MGQDEVNRRIVHSGRNAVGAGPVGSWGPRMRSLTYYVAASADGYVAGPDGQVDFFGFDGDLAAWIIEEYPETLPVHACEALGIADHGNRHYDTVLMGRRTYEPASDPVARVRELKAEDGAGGIWLAGGGRLAAALRVEIDEIVIKRNPVVLGAGVPMIEGSFSPQPLSLTSSRTFDTGVVVESYRKTK